MTQSIFFSPTDPTEILRDINSLKYKQSTGPDNISSCLIKKIKSPLSSPIRLLINKSLEDAVVPSLSIRVGVATPAFCRSCRSGGNTVAGTLVPPPFIPESSAPTVAPAPGLWGSSITGSGRRWRGFRMDYSLGSFASQSDPSQRSS